ncbi:MAG: hypothetical protein ACP5N1_03010 [Candidatus Woesearchaeota archaeon]
MVYRKFKSKAQISVEYMIIIAVSFTILLSGGYFFYGYSKNSNDMAIRAQINKIGETIITNAESIYGLSEGSLVTIDLRYPKNIRDIYILDNNEIVIRYELTNGMNEAVFFSKIRMSGNYSYPSRAGCGSPCGDSSITQLNNTEQGSHQLKFESKTNYVLLSQVK